jgi:AcrR family transcriptional regulator
MTHARARRRQALRTRILDAARTLLQEGGADAFTLRTLGGLLDYAPSALYRHFPSKGALLQALVDADYAAFSAANAPAAEPDPVERIRQGARSYVEFGLTHPDQYRLLFVSPPRGPGAPLSELPSVPVGDPETDRYATLRQAVEEAIATGRFRPDAGDAELITQALWAAVHGVVSLHLIRESQPWLDWRPAVETAACLVESVLRGLAPSGSHPP